MIADKTELTIAAALQLGQERVRGERQTPVLDAQVLIAHIFQKPRSWVLTYPETTFSDSQKQHFLNLISQLESGVPLPYLIGQWEFFQLDFYIDSAVLIPRPETELLVEQAINWLKMHPDSRRAADIGTGSGCIAISLAVHLPDLKIIATDLSKAALAIAQKNAQRHQVVGRIEFVQADIFNVFTKHSKFDIICANLPYIPTKPLKNLDVFGWEPTLALDGGTDGLDLIRKLMRGGIKHLAPGGLLLLEIESTQGETALKLARNFYPGSEITLHQDLAGLQRLIRIQTPGKPH